MTSTLLLVDDEDNILNSLKRLFRRESYRVITARSGAEALELLRHEDVSVILSDQRMPGMTGSELLSQVKNTHPHTIRLIMSGYTELESVTSAINDGAVFKFLVKPWDDDKLLDHIREAFGIHEYMIHKERQRLVLKAQNRTLDFDLRHQRQEASLYQQGMKLAQSILEHVPVMILGLDDTGTLVSANEAARQQLPHEAVIGLPMEMALPSELVEQLTPLLKPSTNAYHEGAFDMHYQNSPFRFWYSHFKGPGEAQGLILVGCPVVEP